MVSASSSTRSNVGWGHPVPPLLPSQAAGCSVSPDTNGMAPRTFRCRPALAGVDVQGDEGAFALTEDGELADDPPRDDVKVVVAVVLAGVREVVVADDDDVLLGLLPEDPAGELAQ